MSEQGNYNSNKKESKVRIAVIGAGGGGVNAVNSMYKKQSNLPEVKFIVCNTDYQSLDSSPCPCKIQLGIQSSEGLGAGKDPEFGEIAAKENLSEVENLLEGVHMVFVTFGAGGGTGSSAGPVIAKAAKNKGILTVGVVTKPFEFEGEYTMEIAENSIKNFKECVDALVIISNEKIRAAYDQEISMLEGFKKVDDVLGDFVASVSRIITKPGLINLDFADVKASLKDMHTLAMVGIGEVDNPEDAEKAADLAVSSPLLENCCIKDAPSVMVSIEGSADIKLCQVHAAVAKIQSLVGKNNKSKNKFFFGAAVDENLKGIRVSILATLKYNNETSENQTIINNKQQELIFNKNDKAEILLDNKDNIHENLIQDELHEEQINFNKSIENQQEKEPWWKRFMKENNNHNSKYNSNDGRDLFNKKPVDDD